MTVPTEGFRDTPKSMEVFFLDNQGAWPKGTRKVGDFVVWEEDDGRYPTFAPVAAAGHPNFDGLIVVLAGNRSLVVSFYKGAKTIDDVKAQIKKNVPRKQFRIAIDAIVHRLVVSLLGDVSKDDADPISVLTWLMRSSPHEGAVVTSALTALLRDPAALKAIPSEEDRNAFTTAEQLLESMQFTASRMQTAAAVAPVKRRS